LSADSSTVRQYMTMASSFRGAWRHRRWRWLLASFAVSSVGDFFYFVALVVFLIESTGSASWIAAAAVARLLAYALLGGLGGVVAGRYDQRRLMVVLDLTRGALMAILALVVWRDGPPALVIALTVVNAVASTPYRPALVAATPALVHEDDLAAANAAESVVGQVAYFLGPALGGLIVAVGGAAVAFAANAVTFVVSAALLTRIGEVERERGRGEGMTREEQGGAMAQLGDGLRTVRAEPGLAALIAFTSTVVFLFGFEQVVHVLVATERLGMSPSGVGILGGAVGVGGLLVAPFTARLGDGPSAGLLLALCGLLMGIPLALLAVISSPVVAVIVLLIEGVGGIGFEVLFITLLQRGTPENMLARVFGLQDSVTAVAQLLGSLLAPILVAGLHLEASLWIGGGIVVAAALLLAAPLNRFAVRADAQRRRFAPITKRLRELGIFSDAPQAALERLARAAQPRSVPAGQTVCAEGDPADDLFVIVSGTASVRKRGRGEVDTLGPDDWFGEVGLIQGAPRNATVSAIDDLELLAISGRVFLDSLNMSETLPDPLRLSLAARSSLPTVEPTRMPP
jgi:predicted MFS family arabinose efflux permease